MRSLVPSSKRIFSIALFGSVPFLIVMMSLSSARVFPSSLRATTISEPTIVTSRSSFVMPTPSLRVSLPAF